MHSLSLKGYSFLVDDDGNVYRAKDMKKYKPSMNKRLGYFQVSAYEDRRVATFALHRLVALATLGERPDGKVIDHIDGNRENNHPSNFRYVTPRENALFSSRTKKYSYSKNDKIFKTSILIEGEGYHLGSFKTKDEAIQAYDKALQEYDENGIKPTRISRNEKYYGVYQTKYGTFKSYAWPNGEKVFLGTYKEKIDAENTAKQYLTMEKK